MYACVSMPVKDSGTEQPCMSHNTCVASAQHKSTGLTRLDVMASHVVRVAMYTVPNLEMAYAFCCEPLDTVMGGSMEVLTCRLCCEGPACVRACSCVIEAGLASMWPAATVVYHLPCPFLCNVSRVPHDSAPCLHATCVPCRFTCVLRQPNGRVAQQDTDHAPVVVDAVVPAVTSVAGL